jgi:hypothetical protein
MRPSEMTKAELGKFLIKQGIRFFEMKPKNKTMKSSTEDPSHDYLFELVIERTGHYLMSNESLAQWEKDDIRLASKLKAKGVQIIPINPTNVIITSHGSSNLYAN